MTVYREQEMEVDHSQIGDRVRVDFAAEHHMATAIDDRGDEMLFLMDG